MKKGGLIIKKAFVFLFIFFFSGIATGNQKPKIIMLIAEQNIGSHYYHNWWGGATAEEVRLGIIETRIAQKLIENGFTVIDPTVLGELKVEKPYRHIDLTIEEAVNIANNYGADVVVIGKGLATKGAMIKGTSMVSSSANITAKVVRAEDRKILAYLSGDGASYHINTIVAGKEALEKAADEVVIKLIEILQRYKPAPSHKDVIAPYKSFSTAKLIYVKGNNINVRKDAGTQYQIVATLKKGDPLKAIGAVSYTHLTLPTN